jgi:hypothetical protein
MMNFLCKSGVPFSSMCDREREREAKSERRRTHSLSVADRRRAKPSRTAGREARRGGGGGSVGGRQIALSPANIYQYHPCTLFFFFFYLII